MADSTSELAQAIQQVSDKATLLIHEEIELAKAEMTEKVTKLAKGAAVGAIGGIFALAALIYLLHSLAWGLWALISDDANYLWLGYLMVGGLLLIVGGLAGFLAARFLKGGSPPTPKMAIEEARLIKETVQTSRPARPIGPTGAVQAPDPAMPERKS
jgi:putative superfamily III holin-X